LSFHIDVGIMKKKWLRWVSLGAVCCPQFLGATSVNGVWSLTAGGTNSWNTTTNWTGGVAPGLTSNNGDTATFNTQSAPAIVELATIGTTLQAMTVTSSSTNSFTFSSTGGSFTFINIAPSTSPSTFTTTSGTPLTTISANVANGSSAQPLNFDLAAGTALTISGIVSDSGGGIGQTVGSSTLTLSASNTYTGPTSIAAGTLALSGIGSISTSSGVDVTIGTGIFDISQASGAVTIGTLSGGGTVAGGSKDFLFGTAASATFSGVIQDGGIAGGTGAVAQKQGSGVQTFTGANTYTGSTIIDGGTLALAGGGTISTSSGVVITSATGIFDISQTATGTTIGTLSGIGPVALGNKTLTFGSSTVSNSFGGVIQDGGIGGGTGGSLIVQGAGTQTLYNANTYTGSTTISAGTLALSGFGSIADSSGVIIDGTFDISQISGATTSVASLSGTGTISAGLRDLVLSGATTTTFSGVMQDGGIGGGTGANLIREGTGTQILAGTNTYTGLTTISTGGTLALSGGGSITDSVGIIIGGTFDISQITGATTTVTSLSGAGIISAGSKGLILNSTLTNIFSGVMQDGGLGGGTGAQLIKEGTGIQILAGANTYSGSTTISAGTLALSGGGSIIDSVGIFIDGTFDISQVTGTTTVTSLSGTGIISAGSKGLIFNSALTNTFSGVMQDGGLGGGTGAPLIKVGTGTLTLAGINTYTGSTTILAGGTLALSGSGSITDSVGIFIGGTFDISQASGAVTIGTLSGGGTVAGGSKDFLFGTAASAIFSGVIQDGGIVGGIGAVAQKQGSGVQTFTGANTYTGSTIIDGGTLALAGGGTISTSSGVVITSATGIFDISQTATGTTIGTLSGIGPVALGNKTLTFGSSTVSNSFGGVIQDGGIGGGTGGSLIIQGAGTQTLYGVNTYTGITTIEAGTLALSGGGSIARSSAVIIDGTFDISQISTPSTSVGSLSGGVGIVSAGSKELILTAPANIFSGIIQDGGLGGGTGAALIQDGTGTQTLAGVNTYTGTTTILEGTLALSGAGSIAASSGLNLFATSAIFDISQITSSTTISNLLGDGIINAGAKSLILDTNNSTSWSGVIQDGGIVGGTGASVTKTGTGTLTVSGVNIFSGVAVIQDGATVAVSPGGRWGTGTLHLGNALTSGTFLADTTVSTGRDVVVDIGGGFISVGTGSVVTATGNLSGAGRLTINANSHTGALLLNGTAAGFTGNIVHTSGRLHINTAIGPPTTGTMVTVNSGATLKGTGTITGLGTPGDVVISSGATLAPGNSVGTINVSGITFAPGSTYTVEVSPSGSSLTNVGAGGTSIGSDVTVTLVVDPGSYSSNIKDLILYSVNGDIPSNAFSALINPSPLISAELLYPDPSHVFLSINFTSQPFSTLSGGFSTNALAVANYLDASAPIAPGTDFFEVVADLKLISDPAQLENALLELQPSHLKGLALAQQSDSMQVNQAFDLRAQSLYLTGCIRDSDKKKKLTLWGDAWGDFIHQEHYQGEIGFHANTGGATLGLDYAVWKNLYLGLGAAYTYSKVDWDQSAGNATAQSFYGLFYGIWFSSDFFVNAALMGAYNHYGEKRQIVVSNVQINRHASADFGGGEVGGYISGGELFKVAGLEFSPFVTLEYYYLYQGGFTEAGAQSIDLKVKSSNTDLLRASLGLEIAKCYVWAKTKWIPSAQVAVVREERFIGRSFQATMKGNESIYFTVYGMKPSRTLVAPLLGITTWSCNDRCSVSLFYSGEFNANYQDQQVNLQVGYGF